MPIVGDDARLAARKADGFATQLADGHREQRHRDALARSQQHVELATIGGRGNLLGHAEQFVGRIAHRRHHHDDVVPRLLRAHDTLGDEAQFLQVSDAASTVLLDDDGHGHQPNALKRKTKNENEERKTNNE